MTRADCQKILDDLAEKHGVKFHGYDSNIDALIRYVWQVGYGQGYSEGVKDKRESNRYDSVWE